MTLIDQYRDDTPLTARGQKRVAAKELDFLRAHVGQWSRGHRNSWVARNRATGVGVILAALGCGYGLAWRDWSALDAALLLYADMLVALLADLLKTGLAPAAVRRAAAEDAEEEHCWSLLLALRFRGIIEGEDIRRAGRTPQVAGVTSATWHPIEGANTRSRSVAGLLAFALVMILLIGAGFWLGLAGAEEGQIRAFSDPGFLFWLGLAAAWRLGDALFLTRRNLADSSRLDLVPGSALAPGIVLLILPVLGLAAIVALPENAEAFWLTAVVAYIFASLVLGGLMILFSWQRDRWLAAFVAKDRRGELAALGDVMTYRATGSAEPKARDGGAGADQRAQDAFAEMEERPDWVSGAIHTRSRTLRLIWVICFFGALTLTAIALAVALIWQQKDAWYATAGLFLLALGFAGAWGWGRLQERMFGDSLLLLEETPLRLGSGFRARLDVRIAPQWAGAGVFDVRLHCHHTRRSGSGDKSRSHTEELWREEWQQQPLRGADGGIVGAVIEGSLPADRPETRFLSGTGSIDKIEWQLEVRMKGPGLGYGATFDLPVFHPDTGIDVRLPPTE